MYGISVATGVGKGGSFPQPALAKFVLFFGFWGRSPRAQTPTGAPPLDPAGGLPSPVPDPLNFAPNF